MTCCPRIRCVMRCRRWRCDAGVNLLEYALLVACVALAGVVTVPAVSRGVQRALSAWSTNVNAVWIPNNPQ